MIEDPPIESGMQNWSKTGKGKRIADQSLTDEGFADTFTNAFLVTYPLEIMTPKARSEIAMAGYEEDLVENFTKTGCSREAIIATLQRLGIDHRYLWTRLSKCM